MRNDVVDLGHARHMTVKRVVLAAGGTGGHIVPAAALYQALNRESYKCTLFTDRSFLLYEKRFPGIERYVLPLCRRSGGAVKLAKFSALFVYSCVLSYVKLRSLKPDLVVGFGAYISFPVLLAARLMSVDVMLHEQNTTLGRVNRVFAKYAKVVVLGLQLKQVTHQLARKAVYTGIPTNIRRVVKRASTAEINLVLLGGSQALCTFGKAFALAITELPAGIRGKVFVTQQCGKGQLDTIKELYTRNHIKHRVDYFFMDMENVINEADLIISRAGATTIAEVMVVGKPAIYIPHMRSVNNHQLHNARLVESLGAGLCIEEKDLNVTVARDTLLYLLNNRGKLREMSDNAIKHSMPDASSKFCSVVNRFFKR
ncbi:UDP-N-acetylglucosamine--N-acetylmuramyl-(pentapeptide) pyrophosphoryl-undecaprenol N-acetylglucosamine transferase [Anaplasma capra]|uniref:UDP-N-acetylglucosamine--N-acetylmuramyl- (pentapeptide) pyrophosphoryl-undecaprenol N-acetylglucosamine transferase n=1 Tax=Anaplasma capra TaxID=1562740 RepID=UPI0021D5FA34|nr:UDP-N-acetylglucosamine--N-acetylmuramyl-(pentapeptide) pyrophosphoryl-undecaprenol N-acetylglucosamine transferase [Anaplasma capra]MCU7611466.1 UDP-N-acetylglucosamine--N-acetylmuramyl-(pentapeptide) pyrophosphoryl-undecaprenol N-acetylglucosamine transferase [Anaplasma capra]MCU7612095.1 UDP-N-acetylglucosamine--N-acetylmuramyl-(pentapeptide) pyrophosphoryl-undecaprenol N-acetylglucosamine transferase [Anaplasma capra]